MNAPITWRNIEAPDFRGATAGTATVSNNLEAARKLFTQSIADTERIDAENWNNTKTNNTNAVLSRLMEYQDPESFEKARQAGEFLRLMNQYGGQIDANLILKSIDERADVLRNRAINALDYQNRVRTETEAQVAREQKPILDRLLGLVEQGELKPATEAARIYADSGMLREDFLWQTLEAARKRQEGIEDRDLNKRNVESAIKARDAQADATRAQTAAARDQSNAIKQYYDFLKAQYELAKNADSDNEKQINAWLAQTIVGQGTLETPTGRKTLEDVLSKYMLSPNAAQDVRQNLEKYFPGGYYTRVVNGKKIQVPVPVDLIDRALAATDEIGNGSLWSRRGDRVHNYVQAALEDPNILKAIQDGIAIRDGRMALRTQAALNPQALKTGANFNTEVLLSLGEWMNPPKK